MLTTASENLGAGHKVSRGLATTLFFLFPAQTRDPCSLSRRPKRPAPNPSSRPRVQTPSPSSPDPGVQAPAPPPDAPPDPQPLLQTRGPDPTLPPSDLGVQTPSPFSRPQGPAPPAPSPSDPGVQTRSPFPLRPGGLVPQPFLAQTQACLLPLTLTQSVPWWHSGWASACPCRGRGFHLWSQQIPPAAGDKTRGCATTPEPAATTEAQAPKADILQPEQPPQGRVPRSPAHRS